MEGQQQQQRRQQQQRQERQERQQRPHRRRQQMLLLQRQRQQQEQQQQQQRSLPADVFIHIARHLWRAGPRTPQALGGVRAACRALRRAMDQACPLLCLERAPNIYSLGLAMRRVAARAACFQGLRKLSIIRVADHDTSHLLELLAAAAEHWLELSELVLSMSTSATIMTAGFLAASTAAGRLRHLSRLELRSSGAPVLLTPLGRLASLTQLELCAPVDRYSQEWLPRRLRHLTLYGGYGMDDKLVLDSGPEWMGALSTCQSNLESLDLRWMDASHFCAGDWRDIEALGGDPLEAFYSTLRKLSALTRLAGVLYCFDHATGPDQDDPTPLACISAKDLMPCLWPKFRRLELYTYHGHWHVAPAVSGPAAAFSGRAPTLEVLACHFCEGEPDGPAGAPQQGARRPAGPAFPRLREAHWTFDEPACLPELQPRALPALAHLIRGAVDGYMDVSVDCAALAALPSLTRLEVAAGGGTPGEDDAGGATFLPALGALGGCTGLRRLRLCGLREPCLAREGLRAVAVGASTLTELRVDGCRLADGGGEDWVTGEDGSGGGGGDGGSGEEWVEGPESGGGGGSGEEGVEGPESGSVCGGGEEEDGVEGPGGGGGAPAGRQPAPRDLEAWLCAAAQAARAPGGAKLEAKASAVIGVVPSLLGDMGVFNDFLFS